LLAAEGKDNNHIATELRTSHVTVGQWRQRVLDLGLAGLQEAPRLGRPRTLTAHKVQTVLTEVVQPPKGRARWSLAPHSGLSHSALQRLWAVNDLKPHRTRPFKLSNDPQFETKFWDIVGAVSGSANAGAGVVLRRKEPVPGIGTHTARATAGTEPHRHSLIVDQCLLAQRCTGPLALPQTEMFPSYSPDFNPLERLWLRLKVDWFWAFIARPRDELTERLCTALESFIALSAKIASICSIRE
jgi:transposase